MYPRHKIHHCVDAYPKPRTMIFVRTKICIIYTPSPSANVHRQFFVRTSYVYE